MVLNRTGHDGLRQALTTNHARTMDATSVDRPPGLNPTSPLDATNPPFNISGDHAKSSAVGALWYAHAANLFPPEILLANAIAVVLSASLETRATAAPPRPAVSSVQELFQEPTARDDGRRRYCA